MEIQTSDHGGRRQPAGPPLDANHENETAPPASGAAQASSSPAGGPSPASDSPDGRAPEGVECWPSPSAVEDCDSPVQVGKRQTIDPKTGEVKRVRKVLRVCRSSDCEACRERKRSQSVAHYTEQFWSAKRLRFVTLTLDKSQLRREGITTEQERKEYLRRIWGLLRGRLDYRCGNVRFYKVLDRDDEDGWHIHAVISANVPERTLRKQWFDVGGGCVMDCQRLRTPSQVAEQSEREQAERSLARAFGYCVHKTLHVDGARGHPSQGDGLSSESSKAKRKRRWQQSSSGGSESSAQSGGHPEGEQSSSDGDSLDTNREPERRDTETATVAVTDESLNSHEAVLEAVKRELRSRVGQWIRLPDGTRARLLKVADTLTVVEQGADRTRTDVQPLDVATQVPDIQKFIPMDRQTGATSDSLGKAGGQVLSDERFERVRQSMRTTTYVGTDEDGQRVRWTYDRESDRFTKETLG